MKGGKTHVGTHFDMPIGWWMPHLSLNKHFSVKCLMVNVISQRFLLPHLHSLRTFPLFNYVFTKLTFIALANKKILCNIDPTLSVT